MSAARTFASLTPPLAPTDWAKVLTRSSSSMRAHPSLDVATGHAAVVALEALDEVDVPPVAVGLGAGLVDAMRERLQVARQVGEAGRTPPC